MEAKYFAANGDMLASAGFDRNGYGELENTRELNNSYWTYGCNSVDKKLLMYQNYIIYKILLQNLNLNFACVYTYKQDQYFFNIV